MYEDDFDTLSLELKDEKKDKSKIEEDDSSTVTQIDIGPNNEITTMEEIPKQVGRGGRAPK